MFRTGESLFAFRPDQAGAFDDCDYNHNRPGHHGEQEHGQVEPERLAMVIDVLREARKVVFEDEHAKEFWISHLYRDVPRQHDGEIEGYAGNPERPCNSPPVALCSDK